MRPPVPRSTPPAPASPPAMQATRYTATTIYVCVMVTLILLAVLFEWRI